jgi:hypothetical protein
MAPPRVHHFHAEATALHAKLQHPLNGEIKPQNHLKLHQEGGYLSDHVKDYRVDNVVSFKAAHTHVAGHESPKRDHPWVTLTTASIEQLNVLEVVTADRLVSQIATEHPREKGHVPTVTFLGTRFENLQVGGIRINLKLKFPLTTLRPPTPDTPYLLDEKFLKEIGAKPASFPELKSQWESCLKSREVNPEAPRPNASATGTLAYDVSLADPKSAGDVKIDGNVLSVPEFGKIILAELTVDCDTFHLTMLRLEMGCLAAGTMMLGGTITNGHTSP